MEAPPYFIGFRIIHGMKLLTPGLWVFVFFCMSFYGEDLKSQNYSRRIHPEQISSHVNGLNPIIWGCQYCGEDLKIDRALNWHISYSQGEDSEEVLIDSFILDFSLTPGFSLDEVNIRGANLKKLSSTKLLVLEGEGRIRGLRQIDINKLDPILYQGREEEINSISVIQGSKKLFPVMAKIRLVIKDIAEKKPYPNVDFRLVQILKKDSLAEYSLKYEFLFSGPQVLNNGYSRYDFAHIRYLISLLRSPPRSCLLQEVPPVFTWGFPSPIPRPDGERSLICVEADLIPNSLNPPMSSISDSRPKIALDGLPQIGEIMNDSIFFPFDSIIAFDANKIIYFYSIPNIRSLEEPELYIYHKGNQLCYQKILFELDGTYFVSLKEKYEPELKFYTVNQPSGVIWADSILDDFEVTAFYFDRYPSSIDFKGGLSPLIEPVANADLDAVFDILERLITAHRMTSNNYAKPILLEELKASGYYQEGYINIYYLDPGISSFRGLFAFDNTIIMNVLQRLPESLTHELGHAFGLRHVFNQNVLNCRGDGTLDTVREENLMYTNSNPVNRELFTLGQLMRMSSQLYSALHINGYIESSDCKLCIEDPNSPYYRRDQECPCVGFNN